MMCKFYKEDFGLDSNVMNILYHISRLNNCNILLMYLISVVSCILLIERSWKSLLMILSRKMLAFDNVAITISFALLAQSFFKSIPKPIFESDIFLLSNLDKISLKGNLPMLLSLLNFIDGGIFNDMSIISLSKRGETPVIPRKLKNLSLVGTKS